MKRLVLFLAVLHIALSANSLDYLTLESAIKKVQNNNLEIDIAKFNEKIKALEHDVAMGQNYGSLDIKQIATRSNDAGNVFGYKLQSREATFGDFGFGQFNQADPNVLKIKPNNLNDPKARNFFQTQLELSDEVLNSSVENVI